MKISLKIGGLAAVCMMLPACATITRGTSQAFVVESEPAGADVKLSNGLACTTPCALKVKRKDGFVAKITKKGYQPIEATVQSQMSGGGGAALAGNVILGGLIGAGVDAATGATKELKPNPLKVKLEPIAESASAPASSGAVPATDAAASTTVMPPADGPAPAAPATNATPAVATPTADSGQPGGE